MNKPLHVHHEKQRTIFKLQEAKKSKKNTTKTPTQTK